MRDGYFLLLTALTQLRCHTLEVALSSTRHIFNAAVQLFVLYTGTVGCSAPCLVTVNERACLRAGHLSNHRSWLQRSVLFFVAAQF